MAGDIEMAHRLATTETAARAAMPLATAAAPDSSKDSSAAQMPAPADREQAIREAAYALFEARGCEPGHELDDWLKAEAQVQQLNREAGASGQAVPVAH
jgi:Protein of unknown function (DUF2934)